jgi:hypothetical protein
MKKSITLFLVAFALAAGVTLALRTARHAPGSAGFQPASERKTVNTLCAICGMNVDPSIPPAEYQGKLVGFGCRACPPRFAADPERWGPSALRNEVLKD